jgi:hypothetical protein
MPLENPDIQTEQRFLPFEVWHPMLLRFLEEMVERDPWRFNAYRIRKEDPVLFRKIEAKSDAVRSLCYPTKAELMMYVAEFASLFPEPEPCSLE